jgi:putative Mg2+ transporter-C (MgtC) family protein
MSQFQLFDGVYLDITLRLVASLVVGGLIGLERSYHGRPAGFRTHSLVCLSTSLLMLVTVYETRWFPTITQGRISLDPTRMAQGIMTGIGFLGAGTILLISGLAVISGTGPRRGVGFRFILGLVFLGIGLGHITNINENEVVAAILVLIAASILWRAFGRRV